MQPRLVGHGHGDRRRRQAHRRRGVLDHLIDGVPRRRRREALEPRRLRAHRRRLEHHPCTGVRDVRRVGRHVEVVAPRRRDPAEHRARIRRGQRDDRLRALEGVHREIVRQRAGHRDAGCVHVRARRVARVAVGMQRRARLGRPARAAEHRLPEQRAVGGRTVGRPRRDDRLEACHRRQPRRPAWRRLRREAQREVAQVGRRRRWWRDGARDPEQRCVAHALHRDRHRTHHVGRRRAE